MEPIDVNVNFENPEFPTRVRIIDLDGTFEHAGDYSAPEYTFSVKVEVQYNRVVDGKENNLLTCTFWTEEDYSEFSYEDDELDECDVEDWFLEGLSEDLSNHDLEGLEDLDFYTLGVPHNIAYADNGDPEEKIVDALEEVLGDKIDTERDIKIKLFPAFKEEEAVKANEAKSKEYQVVNGDFTSEWIVDDYEFEETGNDCDVSFHAEASLYYKDDFLFSFEFWTPYNFPIDADENHIKQVLEIFGDDEWKVDDLLNRWDRLNIQYDLSQFFNCTSFEEFVDFMPEDDSFDELVESHAENNVDLQPYSDVYVNTGDIIDAWESKYDELSDEEKEAIITKLHES